MYAAKMAKVVRQSGVIPYRLEPDGPKVLLITSRKTRRWVIPKGNIAAGESARMAAEREAYEEAGVRGIVDDIPLGAYEYEKVTMCGTARLTIVKVFALHLSKTEKKWPEKAERDGEWITPLEAARRVQEPGLGELFRQLAQRLTVANAA
jgi:8-oxo-dGTP pyrophosphatase MutT (NUDIX family)